MTKKELLNKIDEIGSNLDSLIGNMKTLSEDAKEIYKLIEDLPQEPEEIEDEGKEK